MTINPADNIAENTPVRVVDAIVEGLDLRDSKKLYRDMAAAHTVTTASTIMPKRIILSALWDCIGIAHPKTVSGYWSESARYRAQNCKCCSMGCCCQKAKGDSVQSRSIIGWTNTNERRAGC